MSLPALSVQSRLQAQGDLKLTFMADVCRNPQFLQEIVNEILTQLPDSPKKAQALKGLGTRMFWHAAAVREVSAFSHETPEETFRRVASSISETIIPVLEQMRDNKETKEARTALDSLAKTYEQLLSEYIRNQH